MDYNSQFQGCSETPKSSPSHAKWSLLPPPFSLIPPSSASLLRNCRRRRRVIISTVAPIAPPPSEKRAPTRKVWRMTDTMAEWHSSSPKAVHLARTRSEEDDIFAELPSRRTGSSASSKLQEAGPRQQNVPTDIEESIESPRERENRLDNSTLPNLVQNGGVKATAASTANPCRSCTLSSSWNIRCRGATHWGSLFRGALSIDRTLAVDALEAAELNSSANRIA